VVACEFTHKVPPPCWSLASRCKILRESDENPAIVAPDDGQRRRWSCRLVRRFCVLRGTSGLAGVRVPKVQSQHPAGCAPAMASAAGEVVMRSGGRGSGTIVVGRLPAALRP